MQDQLASRYYIVIYIDSVTKMDGLPIPWFLNFAKNFLEEDFFFLPEFGNSLSGLLITVLSRPKAQFALRS